MQAVPVRYGNPVVSVREPAGRWSTADGGAVLATWRAEDSVLLSDDVRRRADTHLR